MKYSENKQLVALFAKTALLENELAEAIEAQVGVPRVVERHGLGQPLTAAGFLALLVVIGWLVVYQRFPEMTAQLNSNEQARQSEQVSLAARQELDFAQQRLNTAILNEQATRDQLRLDQRARTYVTGITVQPLTANQPIRITANLVNNGKTMAVHAERADAILLATKEPTSFPKVDKWKRLGDLTPTVTYKDNFTVTGRLTQPEIDAVSSGALRVTVYGTLKYQDVFGTLHTTDYCAVYCPDISGFSSCKMHNRAS